MLLIFGKDCDLSVVQELEKDFYKQKAENMNAKEANNELQASAAAQNPS